VNEFEQILLRIRYALQSLNQTHQKELTNFIEHYASEYESRDDVDFEQINMEVEDAKKINRAGNYI